MLPGVQPRLKRRAFTFKCLGESAGRSRTHNQLKQDGAHTPQVGLGVILVELQNLWRHVQWGAAQRLCQALRMQASRKAKVCDFEQLLARLVG